MFLPPKMFSQLTENVRNNNATRALSASAEIIPATSPKIALKERMRNFAIRFLKELDVTLKRMTPAGGETSTKLIWYGTFIKGIPTRSEPVLPSTIRTGINQVCRPFRSKEEMSLNPSSFCRVLYVM